LTGITCYGDKSNHSLFIPRQEKNLRPSSQVTGMNQEGQKSFSLEAHSMRYFLNMQKNYEFKERLKDENRWSEGFVTK